MLDWGRYQHAKTVQGDDRITFLSLHVRLLEANIHISFSEKNLYGI